MTSTDTLLPCPFCGTDELSHGWAAPGFRGGVSDGHVECMECGVLVIAATEQDAIAAWNRRTPPTPATEEPWEGPLTDKENAMLEAAWQKHKDAAPPTPAADVREAVARAERAERSGVLIALWAEYRAQSSEKLPVTIDDAHSRHRYLVSAFADAALSALAPIRAAEILAAEANERARIASNETAWLLERDYFGQLRYFSAACQDEAPTDWTPDNLQALRFARRIDAERFASREATDCIDIRVVEHMWCAIEHGAGK